MTTRSRLLAAMTLTAFTFCADARAQPAAGPSPVGHWVGTLDVGPGWRWKSTWDPGVTDGEAR